MLILFAKSHMQQIPNKTIIVVGLPVRNEEQSLLAALNSIRKAMISAREDNIRLVICCNGCSDHSLEIAKSFLQNNSDITIDVIESEEGLVNAQRTIVNSFPADIYVFPDSDNVIDEQSIFCLLQELHKNPKTIVAYGKTISLPDSQNRSPFHSMGLLYDSQKMLTKRHYFHGRLFATRDWYIPTNAEIYARATVSARATKLLKYCTASILLSADDIYMSSYIMDKYGKDSIIQVEDATCYSWPVASFHDWYHVYRRRNIEMEKMYRWYPEFNYLKPYLDRRTDWRKWIDASFGDKTMWLGFLTMRGIFFVSLSIELLLLSMPMYWPLPQWNVTKTTKKKV